MTIDTLPYAPTSFLPPLAFVSSRTSDEIADALKRLHLLYWSPARLPIPLNLNLPTRNFCCVPKDDCTPDSGYASAEEDNDSALITTGHPTPYDLAVEDERTELRTLILSDAFERDFAIRWVTGLVTRSEMWINSMYPDHELETRNDVLSYATDVLSLFTRSQEGDEQDITRSFSFAVENQQTPMTVELNDAPLPCGDHTAVGLQSWGSSILMAQRMCASPSTFNLTRPTAPPTRLRVLELGAGTGLLSIAAAKLLAHSPSEVVATDYHTDVLANLSSNVERNFGADRSLHTLAVHALDWSTPCYDTPFDEPFDIILAADVIYHPKHAEWIRNCVSQLLRRSSLDAGNNSAFWLIIPLRTTGRHENMHLTVDALYPRTAPASRENTLVMLDQETVGRNGALCRVDEGGYILYKIGWAC